MELKFLGINITNNDIEQKIQEKINFEEFENDKEYDVSAMFYNRDLIDDSLNEDVPYEIKKKHYKFIKIVRDIFEKNNIKINKFYLMGTIVELLDDEIDIAVRKSNYKGIKSNVIWPCKEIFIYEDGKNKLDSLLFTNQISMEEYESNLEDLKYELSIYENEEELEYLN
nr:hypothetical protein [Sedimentibacter sp.]